MNKENCALKLLDEIILQQYYLYIAIILTVSVKSNISLLSTLLIRRGNTYLCIQTSIAAFNALRIVSVCVWSRVGCKKRLSVCVAQFNTNICYWALLTMTGHCH